MTTTTDPHSEPAGSIEPFEAVCQQLLQTNPQLASAASRLMANQTAALMLEDMRCFLQGSEQLLFVALAKAAHLATEETTTEQGKAALSAVTDALQGLTGFARELTAAASAVATAFDGKTTG